MKESPDTLSFSIRRIFKMLFKGRGKDVSLFDVDELGVFTNNIEIFFGSVNNIPSKC